MSFRKKYRPYRLYIPENLLIDELLTLHPPDYKRRPKRYRNYRDPIIYTLHIISSIPNSKNDFDFEKTMGFIPIHKESLRNRIHEYRAIINYLKSQGIIEEGTNYVVGQRSMGLRFSRQYITKVKPVLISSTTLIKSIVNRLNNRDFDAEEKLKFLFKWFNPNLTIDMEKALEFLEKDKLIQRKKIAANRASKVYTQEMIDFLPPIEDIVMMGYNSKFITADKIHNADFNGYVKIDNNTGRLHSPLTQLKKGLRKHLKYNGDKLCNIDIVNSQPLLALIILDFDLFVKMRINDLIARYNPHFKSKSTFNPNTKSLYRFHNYNYTMLVKMIKTNSSKEDVILFKETVINGTFYETFSSILIEKGLLPEEILSLPDIEERKDKIRDFAKKATFRAFFEKVYASRWCEYVRAFKSCFPNVFAIFQFIKKGKGEHNTLACIFQRFESYLILHVVCADINKNHPDIPLYTIHDSILTTTQNSEIVQHYFMKHLKEILGIEPKLKLEEW